MSNKNFNISTLSAGYAPWGWSVPSCLSLLCCGRLSQLPWLYLLSSWLHWSKVCLRHRISLNLSFKWNCVWIYLPNRLLICTKHAPLITNTKWIFTNRQMACAPITSRTTTYPLLTLPLSLSFQTDRKVAQSIPNLSWHLFNLTTSNYSVLQNGRMKAKPWIWELIGRNNLVFVVTWIKCTCATYFHN